jgi:hypothetical protein
MPSLPCCVCGGNRGSVPPSRYFEGYTRICSSCKGKPEVQKEYHCKSLTVNGKPCRQFRLQNSKFCQSHINHHILMEEE